MNEERANDRDATDMNQPSEHQHLFDAAGHLTSNALNDSIDGALSSPDDARVQAHLAGCNACSTRRHELAQTVALLRSLPEVDPGRSFAIAPQAAGESSPPTVPRYRSLITPAFPVLRIAVAAVFLLLVGVTATDLITQPNDDQDQVAMVADTPAARNEPALTQEPEEAAEPAILPLPTGAAPAAAGANMEAGESQESLPAGQPSEAFGQAVADEDTGAVDAEMAQEAADGADAAIAPAATPEIEPSPTTAAPETRVEATEDDDDGLSNWRIAEIALLLLLFWLVVTWFGLERMRKR